MMESMLITLRYEPFSGREKSLIPLTEGPEGPEGLCRPVISLPPIWTQ